MEYLDLVIQYVRESQKKPKQTQLIKKSYKYLINLLFGGS